VIPFYENQSHFLRLPKDKIAVFASNENRIYAYVQREKDLREKPFQVIRAIAINDTINNFTIQRITLPKNKYHKVKRGENLTEIADKYNVTVADIKKWNGLKKNTVSFGKNLKIVTSESIVKTIKKEPKVAKKQIEIVSDNPKVAVAETKTVKIEVAKKPVKADTLATDTASFYVVQKGDNLGNIAKKYNVTVEEIKTWNHLSDVNIKLGTSLQVANKSVETKEENTPAPKLENIEYVVLKGDNLGKIAKKFGTSLEDLKQWNNLKDQNIALGVSLIVAKNEVAILSKTSANTFKKNDNLASRAKKNSSNYYVKKGDSLFSIAKKYPGVSISDIKKWNDISGEELKPGMKLKING
jgi:membrane-bound lytic murein transglycosylase D